MRMSDEKGELSVENHYKSCFARSVVVNSQFAKLARPQEALPVDPLEPHEENGKAAATPRTLQELQQEVACKAAKSQMSHNGNMGSDDSGSSRSSFSRNRIADIPVEKFYMQSHMEILQWQLKQTEASREMYRAVMKQVVVFLERAHRSLEMLNTTKTVPRSRSEHHMSLEENGFSSCEGSTSSRDFTWHRPKSTQIEETSPEKLSQEAFRLLRTAQSLLSTCEPDLARVNTSEDMEFISQLAKEFPSPEVSHHKEPSLSLNPKLLTPEKDYSSVFSRKFSLPLNCSELRRNSLIRETLKQAKSSNSAADVVESESRVSPVYSEIAKLQTSGSPPVGSVSSAEDESGFSSMNSFQDVGLPPPVNHYEVVTSRESLLKSMLRSSTPLNEPTFSSAKNAEDLRLWQKPQVYHRRRNSSPIEAPKQKTALKVLWV